MRANADTSQNELPAEQFLSIPEVQAFLGIKSRKTILRYINSGKLRAYKIAGTRWRISSNDVIAFLRADLTAFAGPVPINTNESESVLLQPSAGVRA